MKVEAEVVPNRAPVGASMRSALNLAGSPRVFIELDDVVDAVKDSGGDFIDGLIDGGVADSTYSESFDIDGGGA